MRYVDKYIKIKSNWFDYKGKILKTGVDGYNLYLNLYRFKIPNQKQEMFITSVGLLRRQLPKRYTTSYILDLLKVLAKNKVIKVDNLSRWDQLIVDGKIDDNRVLIIHAIDIPVTERKNERDMPIDKDNNYISIDLTLMEHYKSIGLDERYYLFYALARKWNTGSQGFNMSIDKIGDRIGISKNTVNKMIWSLMEHYLLISVKEKKGAGKYNFHHFICHNLDSVESFKKNNREKIDRELNGRKSKSKSKKAKQQQDDNKDLSMFLEDDNKQNDLAFGVRGTVYNNVDDLLMDLGREH